MVVNLTISADRGKKKCECGAGAGLRKIGREGEIKMTAEARAHAASK